MDTTFSGTYGAAEITNGTAKIKVKASETAGKKIEGLPNGTKYKFVEDVYTSDGYTASVTEGSLNGTIEGGEDKDHNNEVSVTVNNARSAGSLTVSKTTEGNDADLTKAFSFTVTLGNDAISGTYGEMEFTDGVAEFTLANGESMTASDLPVGTTYTVAEEEADADGYVTTVESSGTVEEDKTVTGEITSGAANADFTNTKNTYGDIVLKKTVSGDNADPDK